MLYAGMDVHKNHCQVVVCEENGKVVKEERIPSEREDIQRFFRGSDKMKIVMEATSCFQWIYDLLEEEGHEVHVSNPIKTRVIAESRVKTDKIDAKILVDLLRGGFVACSYVPPEDIRALRELCRHRIYLGRLRTCMKNKIHATLLRKGMKYEGKVFTKSGISWLRNIDDRIIRMHLSSLEALEKEIEIVEREIKREGMKRPEIRLLITIPGLGVYGAMVIFSEIGDINRFPTEEKLFAYSGLVPSINQSGDHCFHGRITKTGSSNLRFILTQAVKIHLQIKRKTKLKEFYYRLRKNKPNSVATVATARKMLQIIYWMLKRNEPFRGWSD